MDIRNRDWSWKLFSYNLYSTGSAEGKRIPPAYWPEIDMIQFLGAGSEPRGMSFL